MKKLSIALFLVCLTSFSFARRAEQPSDQLPGEVAVTYGGTYA